VFWLGTWHLTSINKKHACSMFSLVRFGQPLQNSPSQWRVSNDFNGLQRRPTKLQLIVGFCWASQSSRVNTTLLLRRLQAFIWRSRCSGSWEAVIVGCAAFLRTVSATNPPFGGYAGCPTCGRIAAVAAVRNFTRIGGCSEFF